MIHAREDYNRIQDPATENPRLLPEGSTPIGKREPVFLLRAQDKNFVLMLHAYRNCVIEDSAMTKLLDNHIELAKEWQSEHGCKTPDLPTSE